MAVHPVEKQFFEHLKAQFETSFSDSDKPQAALARSIIQRYVEKPGSLAASDVYALEMIILGLQPTEQLIQRAPALRAKYHELVGDQIFAAYRPAEFPTDLKDEKQSQSLRVDLQQILHFLHWSYVFGPIRELLRTRLIKAAIAYIAGYTVLWGVLIFLFFRIGHPFLAVLATVAYSGLIGGFISSQRRQQTIPTRGDPLASIYELENGKYFLWFAPLTGAIFAVVLMLFFIGGILQGAIFPAFYIPSVVGNAPQSLLKNAWQFTSLLLPKSGADYALLFLWAFIAGFAERVVPDALDRLASRAKQAQEQTLQTKTEPQKAEKQTTDEHKHGQHKT